ncbi:ATP-binding cassette domain-containing protein [Nesterenkonia pannonica]|uniref:ATP-binding cassette domain-containing protein n=1 Tax=Nesterenkonia pannonica TaxID=1548602 RepID=UPI002164412C|nr:ATP-binding cassette domain-containing protein [Nesterenkonia pannonica]
MPQSYGERRPDELSGGQRQRVALARALARAPQVILLDEPFSALDAGLRERTRKAVQKVLRATGTTALLVTHDQDEALSFADQVAVLTEGRIRQTGRLRTYTPLPRIWRPRSSSVRRSCWTQSSRMVGPRASSVRFRCAFPPQRVRRESCSGRSSSPWLLQAEVCWAWCSTRTTSDMTPP